MLKRHTVLSATIVSVLAIQHAHAADFEWEIGSGDNGGVWGGVNEWAGPAGQVPDDVNDTARIADVGGGLSAIRLDDNYTIGDLVISGVSDYKPIWLADALSNTSYLLDANYGGSNDETFTALDSDVLISGRGVGGELRFVDGRISALSVLNGLNRSIRPSDVRVTDQAQLLGNTLEVSLDSLLHISGNGSVIADSITVGAETYFQTIGDPASKLQPAGQITLLNATDFNFHLETQQLDLVHGRLEVLGGSRASLGEVTLGQAGVFLVSPTLDGDITVDGNLSSAIFESIELISGDILVTNDADLTQSTSTNAPSSLGDGANHKGGTVTISNGGTLRLATTMSIGGQAEVPLLVDNGTITAADTSLNPVLRLRGGNDAPATHTVTNGGSISDLSLVVWGNSLTAPDQTVLDVDAGGQLDVNYLGVVENARVDVRGTGTKLMTQDDKPSGVVASFGEIEAIVDNQGSELIIRDDATFDIDDLAVFRLAELSILGNATGSINSLEVDQGGIVDIAGTNTEVTLDLALRVDSDGPSDNGVAPAPSFVTVRDGAKVLGLADLLIYDDATVRFLSGAKGAFDDALLNGGVLDVIGNDTRVNVSGANTLHIGYTNGGNINQPIDMVVNVENGAELNSVNLVVGDTDGNGRLFGRTGAQITTDALEIGTALNSSAAVQLEDENTLLTVNGDATIGGSGLLNVLSGALADINGQLLLTNGGDATILGGTLEVDSIRYTSVDSSRDLQYGTVRFTQDTLLDAFTLNNLIGSTRVLGPVQTIDVQGEATLSAPLEVDGGTLAVDTLANADFLTLTSGTFRYRGDGQWDTLEIDDDGPLGPVVEIAPGLTIQGEARTISGEGSSVGPRVGNDGLVRIYDGGSFEAVDTEGQTDGEITNRGEIALLGPTARLLSDDVDNTGLIRGSGRITGRLNNRPSGWVEVGQGERMVFQDLFADNNGSIVVDGGQIEFQRFENGPDNADAELIITDGTLFVLDDFRGFENGGRISGTNAEIRTVLAASSGDMVFTGQDNRLYGDWENEAGGVISVGGNGKLTFFDTLVQDGEVIVADGSSAVFLDDVSGNGSFGGGGTIEFVGQVQPGSSPGGMSFNNDVSFQPGSTLIMEIAGLLPGSEHDFLELLGSLDAQGKLQVELIDGHLPTLGNEYDLLDVAEILSWFDEVDLPELQAGLQWQNDLQTDGTITVIPEPTTALLLAVAGVAGLRPRRRGQVRTN